MYIVAIAWLYVTLLVSVMQPTLFRGIVTFIGTGLIPLGLLLYLLGSPQRRRNAQAANPDRDPVSEAAGPPASKDDDPSLRPEDRSR
jgi:hypothetical protein